MRIQTIDLRAFGRFTDKSIDLSGKTGLNIIFGPNEAGKSTTMRALDAFFFGFGLKSRDAFVHGYKDLAVRAVLETDPGKILDLTRYKRNKNDLVDAYGQAVEPGVMNRVMAGLTRDMYANMFGLDHLSLRQGAEEILKGGGHLGETLFAAASGITSLRLALDDLRKKADALFRPRASSRPIWQSAVTISQLNKQLRELSVRPEEWRNLKYTLDKLKKEKEDLELEIRDLESSLHRHKRFYRALPHITAYNELNAGLKSLESIPELSPDFTGKRIKVLAGINRLTHDLKKLVRIEADLSLELEKIQVCEKTISFAGELERLFHQIQVIVEARENVSSLELEIRSLEGQINELTGLLPDKTLPDNPEDFRISPAMLKKMEGLAGEIALLESSINQTEKDIRDLKKDLEHTEKQLTGLPPAPEAKQLEIISRKMSVAQDILKQESSSKIRQKKLKAGIEKSIKSLGLWQGGHLELAGLALPMRETIDSYEQKISSARQEMEFAKKDLSETEKSLAAKRKALSGLDPHETIPGPDVLARVRALRDHGWSLIRSSWIDNAEKQPETRDFLEQTDSAHLADGFENSMFRADQTADILMEKADQVAAKAGLALEIQGLKDKKQTQEQVLESGKEKYARIMEQWTDLWSGLNIAPLSPREMAAWISRVQDILRSVQDLENESLELHNIREKIKELESLAGQALSGEGLDAPGSADLTTLCALIEDARNKALELISARKDLERDRKKIIRSLDKLLARQNDFQLDLDDKTGQWSEILTGSGLEPGKDPRDILEEVRTRRDIHSGLRQLDKLSRQKAGLEKKILEFSGQTSMLLKNLEHDQTDQGRPEDIISRLHVRLKDERKKSAHKDDLLGRLADAKDKISETSAELAVLEGELKIICREGGADDPEELPEIEQKSTLKKELKVKLEYTLDNLRELSSGEDIGSFLVKAGGFDSDELQGIIAGLEKEKQEKNPRLEKLIKDSLEAELRLRDMDGTSRVPEIEQQIQEQRAFLENNVDEYVRLHLAACILTSEIERYRTANQGPVLKTAGQIFGEITLNSFSTIMADYDEKGEPVIRAVRDSGARLGVDELSDGTRDQLFLALRLGGIYRYLDQNPPFPFMVDDILVHFDDERSKKTLSVLARLCRNTQVLFFTHHNHLVDLARQIPEKHMVEVHELAEH